MIARKLGHGGLMAFFILIAATTYAAPDFPPSNLQGQAIDATTIRWTWTDDSSDEDGFELRDTSDNRKVRVGAGITTCDETGLSENTQYTRRVVGFTESLGAEQDALTYSGTIYSNTSSQTGGFKFTANADMRITKVKTYINGVKVKIWEVDNETPVRIIDPAAGDASWPSYDVTPPLDVYTGETYVIAVYATGYRYTSMGNATPTGDLGIDCSCYSSGDATYPLTENPSYMYGLVNFVYRAITIDPSTAAGDTPIYTAVHDPLSTDFSLTDDGSGNVTITAVAPPNGAVEQTGFWVQRILDGQDWASDAVDITTSYDHTYSVGDTPPANGTYLYRIRYCNGDEVPTAWSQGKSITIMSYPPTAPSGFSGTLTSPTSITWQWTDESSDEEGFVIEDDSMPANAFIYTDPGATSVLDDNLVENTEYTRQCKAFRWKFYPEGEACTYDGTYSTSSSSYHRGFLFIPQADMDITRLSRYAGSVVRLHDYSGTLLQEHTFSSSPDAEWVEEDLSTPWTLIGGVPYRISVYSGGSSFTYYYDSLSSVTEVSDIDILGGCYGSTYPSGSYTTVYGLVNFKYRVNFHAAAGYDGAYYSSSTSAYPRGFRFTTSQDIWVTRLSRLRGTRVTIHDDATQAVLLEHVFSSAPDNEWTEEDVAVPLTLEAGKTYRISTWNDGTSFTYTYEYLSNVRNGTTLTINSGCYGNSSSGQWPITTNTSFVYGLVNFMYVTERNSSSGSGFHTVYTPVHEPVVGDLQLTDGGGAQVLINITKPANHDVGDTSVYIERSDDPDFGTVTVVDNGWLDGTDGDSDPFTRTDTVPSNGMWYYRMKYRNQVSTETGWLDDSIYILSYPPADPSGFAADSGSVTTTSITWRWTDNADYEAGFELQDGSGGWVADAAEDAESYKENGLSENTQYTRDVVAYNLIPGTEAMDQSQEVIYTYRSDMYGDRKYAQTFTPGVTGTLTKIELYAETYSTSYDYDLEVSIYPTTGGEPDLGAGALAVVVVDDAAMGTTAAWQTVNFSSPPFLTQGTLYAIVFRTITTSSSAYYRNYVYYENSDSYAGGQYFYYDGVNWTSTATYDFMFRTHMIHYTRNYSGVTTSDACYTLVHDPGDADLALNDLHSGGQIEVVVTPPPNPAADQTAVYIERDSDPEFSSPVVIDSDWTKTYTHTDTVPANGIFYYRITFRNGDGVETEQYVDSIDVVGFPPIAPDGFYGDGVTPDSITWNWNDNSSDEHGFEIQDGDDSHVIDAAADATSIVEPGLTENTIYDRHCHSYVEAGAGAIFLDIFPDTAAGGSNPSANFVGNGEAIGNLQTEGDSLYWSCDRQDFYLVFNDPQEIWTEFEFDISSTGLSGSEIESLTFTSKVYFTGSTSTAPITDPMEINYIDEARVQIYNNISGTWETLGTDFLTALGRSSIWTNGTEAALWDNTSDTNPNNPIVRSKDSGWTDDYIDSDTVKIRVFISGAFPSGSSNSDAMWVFDYVKIDLQERQVRLLSTETTNATVCTLVHDPVDTDIEITDLYTGGQVEVKVTPPFNSTLPDTAVYIERALDGDWGGPTYGVVDDDWTQTYTHTDTLSANGAWHYRIKFRNQVGVETNEYIKIFDMGSFPPDVPDGFQADGATMTSTSITWKWNDKSTNEEGFELQDGSDTWIADAAAGATSYTESGLTENTQYTRHIRAYSLIPGSEIDAVTYATTPSNGSSYDYTMGFRFTANADITITKVKAYQDTMKVTIWDDSGVILATVDPATSASGWTAHSLSSPLALTSGQTYRIAAFTNPYHSTSMSNVTSSPDITVLECRYSSGDNFPTSQNTGTMYGVVNFVYRTYTKSYSGISEEISIYTPVHEPTTADFTVTPGAFGEADIVVTPPNNSDVGDTGVRIRRSPNADMSGAVVVKDFDVTGYDYTDTVPSGGIWYYAITFCNAEGLLTGESSPRSEDIPGPLPTPGSFTGAGSSTTTIDWSWTEVTEADSYLFQDGSGNTLDIIDKPATYCQETVGGENAPSTRQLRSAVVSTTQLSVDGIPVQGSMIPWYVDGARVQLLYTKDELSGAKGLITKIYWKRNLAGATDVTFSNVTIKMGHTTLSSLGSSFAGNYTEDDASQVWFAASHIVNATTADAQWYEITLDNGFYYDGVNNLIVDFNVQSGTDSIGWARDNAASDTLLYGYPGGTVGTPYARKLFMKFEMEQVTSQSEPAGPVTAYSLIHDATMGDFTLIDTGSLGVNILIQQPPNPTAGSTGVKVERADDEFFTAGVVTVQEFAPVYSLTDTVSATGRYWYRITYRNGGMQESGTSPSSWVDVTGTAVPPIASFSATPTSGYTPLTVDFTDESSGTITTWSWDFGDGTGTSTQKSPTYEYTSTGTYTVSLTVTGPLGSDTMTATDYITVSEPPAIYADFTAEPQSGEEPLLVQFYDASTGTVTSWEWDFDNDTVIDSTAQNPTHIYPGAGLYTVKLTVTGLDGSDSETKTDFIEVVPPGAPIADFSANPTSGLMPLAVDFFDESSGTVNSWQWDFDNDTVIDSTAQNPTHIYPSAGLYTVKLTVTGPGGSDFETKTDYIEVTTPPAPIANFSASPTSGLMPLAVDFFDESSGSITSWEWDFDNDTVIDSTAQNPTHIYPGAGFYTVSLTVTGPGGSDTETKVDYIEVTTPTPPEAEFSADPTNGSAPLLVSFTDLSTGDVTEWTWDFGDSGASSDQHPTHEYTDPGTYTVTLTVSGPGGSDFESKTDYIIVNDPSLINAEFSAAPTNGPAALTVNFTNESTGTFDSWLWDFGDGTDSYDHDPVHTYNLVGEYTVTLRIDGPIGSDSETKTNYIVVIDPGTVTADFTADPTDGRAALDVQFTDQSVGAVDAWLWDFGDGGTSTEHNPVHRYTEPGTYTVTLSASGPSASDSETKTDYIHVTGLPLASSDKKSGCSCTVDTAPVQPGDVLGYFVPALLLGCAFLALRRRSV